MQYGSRLFSTRAPHHRLFPSYCLILLNSTKYSTILMNSSTHDSIANHSESVAAADSAASASVSASAGSVSVSVSVSDSLLSTVLSPALLSVCAAECFVSYLEFNRSVGLPDEFASQTAVEAIMRDALELQAENRAVYRVFMKKKLQTESATDSASDSVSASAVDILGSGCVYLNPDESAMIGMISVSTRSQGLGLGKLMMKILIQEYDQWKISAAGSRSSLRLVQISSNIRSLSLYSALGFDSKEQLLNLTGEFNPNAIQLLARHNSSLHRLVRRMRADDFAVCNQLFVATNGIGRLFSIRRSFDSQFASPRSDYFGWARCLVIEENGSIIGYSTGCDGSGHTIAPDQEAFAALYCYLSAGQRIQAERVSSGLPILVDSDDSPPFSPSVPDFHCLLLRYPSVARYFINSGLRAIRQLTLMAWNEGFYQEPKGNLYFPSIEW